MTPTQTQKRRIRKLIDALRSRKYKQATGALHKRTEDGKDTYCCLGVACDLYSKATKTPWGGPSASGITPFLNSTGSLPLDVQKYYGFVQDDPLISFGPLAEYATNLNDHREWGFAKIASAFERTYFPKKKAATK